MSYNTELAQRIRLLLQNRTDTYEKEMFGGLCYMVDDKMCCGIVKEELMCRLNPDSMDTICEERGVRPMDFTGKRMKGFVFVALEELKTQKQLKHWIDLCLGYNPIAKSSKKKTK